MTQQKWTNYVIIATQANKRGGSSTKPLFNLWKQTDGWIQSMQSVKLGWKEIFLWEFCLLGSVLLVIFLGFDHVVSWIVSHSSFRLMIIQSSLHFSSSVFKSSQVSWTLCVGLLGTEQPRPPFPVEPPSEFSTNKIISKKLLFSPSAPNLLTLVLS